MPVVLTQNEVTASGHSYADVLGVSYEYPRRYRSLIVPAERFVYYRGRRRPDGPNRPQAYLGTGVIGDVAEAANGLLRCSIENFQPFEPPIEYRDAAGEYFERAAYDHGSVGFYFQPGVRRIDEATFERILVAAGADTPDPVAEIGTQVVRHQYPSPELARRVDAVAMDIAFDFVRTQWPALVATRMHHNNPGFDIKVQDRSGEIQRFVEVKGTTRARPAFYLSEGERLFSHGHADLYTLVVVYGIDLEAKTGTTTRRDGALSGSGLTLDPLQWAGALVSDA